MISPIPAASAEPVSRSVSHKRIHRLRVNWFMVGSVFGVAVSFFMNFFVSAIIMPQYEAWAGRKGSGEIAFADEQVIQKEKESKVAAIAKTVTQEVEDAKEATIAAFAPEVKPEPKPVAYPRELTLKVENGDTLIDMLVANNVPNSDAHNVVDALRTKFNPRNLKIGQEMSLTLARHETVGSAAAVQELAIKLPNLSTVELKAAGDKFNVAAVKAELKDRAYRGYGIVKTSLSQAGADARIPGGAMGEVVQAFSYDVDFQRDIHPGDTIEVLLDRKETAEGQIGGYNNVRYAALTLGGKKHEIFRFKDSYGVAWYDAKGNAVKKSLLRTPINAARITSGFGMRRHPIMGYSKMHQGVDFGASTGTPIMAAGDGVVKQRGWSGGYGNFVLIQHNGTYSTAYGHMSRFGNIKLGGRVKQGQVIGYVGSTGRSTGPHLHYEVRANGRQVNPAARQFNLANGLTGKQLAAFNAQKQSFSREMASLKRNGAADLASR
jgi:murein DD-endopeptidase MepM/ murein hydrolase activator NlpD